MSLLNDKGGFIMAQSAQLVQIKNKLNDNLGKRVELTAKNGRKKNVVRQGIIEQVFSSIFIIQLDDDINNNIARKVSYSYKDILTHNIEIALCAE